MMMPDNEDPTPTLLAPLAVSPLAFGDSPTRLGIVGGTFDPIHLGHVRAGVLARDELDLNAVLYMPTRRSNFKRASVLTPAADRLAMARLAVAGYERFLVSTRELVGDGVAYTADTLRQMRRDYPDNVELMFIMGSDSLQTLAHWHDSARIAQLATIVCVPRDGHNVQKALENVHASGLDFDIKLVSSSVPDISSTKIRELIASGQDPVTAGMLDSRVGTYIADHRLYRQGNLGRSERVEEDQACS